MTQTPALPSRGRSPAVLINVNENHERPVFTGVLAALYWRQVSRLFLMGRTHLLLISMSDGDREDQIAQPEYRQANGPNTSRGRHCHGTAATVSQLHQLDLH